MLKAVLLDLDGTLVDSNDAHAKAWVEALAEAGHEVPFIRIRRLIGMGADKLLPAVAGLSAESPEGQRISERRSEIFCRRHLPGLGPFPAAATLCARMRDQGLRLVIASSAKKQELSGLLRVADVESLIEDATSGDDAEHSKPDPDIVRAALATAGCAAEEALMLGDTPYDVEAAGRAGVAIVALRCGGWDDRALAGAVAVYDDPAALLARFDDSPFATPRSVA
jgi:phosphoglycolate phosphatase-like HAD superfamily hydrolase